MHKRITLSLAAILLLLSACGQKQETAAVPTLQLRNAIVDQNQVQESTSSAGVNIAAGQLMNRIEDNASGYRRFGTFSWVLDSDSYTFGVQYSAEQEAAFRARALAMGVPAECLVKTPPTSCSRYAALLAKLHLQVIAEANASSAASSRKALLAKNQSQSSQANGKIGSSSSAKNGSSSSGGAASGKSSSAGSKVAQGNSSSGSGSKFSLADYLKSLKYPKYSLGSTGFGFRSSLGNYTGNFKNYVGSLPTLKVSSRSGSTLAANGQGVNGLGLFSGDMGSCGGGILLPGLVGGDKPLQMCIFKSPFETPYQSVLNSW